MRNTEKVIKAASTEPENEPSEMPPAPTKTPAGWDGGRIIWGLVAIAVGVLFLLETLGVVTLNFAALWQLWPLLIIMAGLSVLALRGWVAVTVSLVAAVMIVGIVILSLTGTVDMSGERQREDISIIQAQAGVSAVDVYVKTGAVALDVSAHDGAELVTGALDSNSLNLTQDVSMEGTVQKVALSMDGGNGWWRGNVQSDLAVQLTRKLPVTLRVDAGAASIRADLSQVNTRSVEVDSGASKIWLKLGNKQAMSDVSVDTGASSVEMLVPQAAGVRVQLDTGLSSELLPDDLEKVGESTYQSPGYDQRANKINISVDMGISSFRLSRY